MRKFARNSSIGILLALLLFAGILGSNAAEQEKAKSPTERFEEKVLRRAFVRVDPKIKNPSKYLSQKLPSRARVLEAYKSSVIVEFKSQVTEADLKLLRAIPSVTFAEPDEVYSPQLNSMLHPDECHTGDLPFRSVNQFVKEVARPAAILASSPKPSDKPCGLFQTCSQNFKTRLWGQIAVDGDLMLAEMETLGIPKGTVKVAVVDTGFDRKGNAEFIASPSLTIQQGHTLARIPEDDVHGHGTAVAGLIGGKEGVGLAPHAPLSVYSAPEPGEREGRASRSGLKLSLEKACSDGNEIINMSYGSTRGAFLLNPGTDEKMFDSSWSVDRAFMDQLAARGCLVFQSAGNSGTRNAATLSSSLDEPITRVEASKPNGRHASFSSLGVITAPGEGVFTLKTTLGNQNEDDWTKKQYGCEGSHGKFISGTSFASPISAAIAANVLSVLKTGPRYASLTGPDRIRLINRILKASESNGTINGLRAVRIARRWSDLTQAPSVGARPEEFAALLDQELDPVCSQSPSACVSGFPPCSERKLCLDHFRKTLALCPGAQLGAANRIIELAESEENLELMLKAAKTVVDSSASGAVTPTQVGKRTWESFVRRWQKGEGRYPEINLQFGLDPEVASALLPLLAKEALADSKGFPVLEKAFQTYFNSYLVQYMNDDFRKEHIANLENLIRLLGPDSFLNLIASVLKAGAAKLDAGTAINLMRLLNDLNQPPLNSSFKSLDQKLAGLDSGLAEMLRRQDVFIAHLDVLREFSIRALSKDPFFRSLEMDASRPFELSYFELESVMTDAKRLAIKDLFKLGSILVKSEFPRQNRNGARIGFLIEQYHNVLGSRLESARWASAEEQREIRAGLAQVRAEIQAEIAKPDHVMLAAKFFKGAYGSVSVSSASLLRQAPVLDLNDACQTGYRIAAALAEAPASYWSKTNLIDAVRALSFLGTIPDCGIALGDVALPSWDKASASQTVKAGPTSEVLDKLLASVIEKFKSGAVREYEIELAVLTLMEDPSLKKLIPKDGAGMNAVRWLADFAEKNTVRFRTLEPMKLKSYVQ